MQPVSISEQLMYNTIRLEGLNGTTGTGFFFSFVIDDKKIPCIITNKHVVNNNEYEVMKFNLHIKKDGIVSDENHSITYFSRWFFHPDKDIDLCFCFASPVFIELKEKYNKEVYFIEITSDIIYSDNKLKQLSALEEVLMIGYPNGLWDKINNFPLLRTGSTASHPGYDFNNRSIGVVDMSCFPGSSGSPIFIINDNGYFDKTGEYHLGQKRAIFLGVLFSGPVMNSKGDISVENIPTNTRLFSNTNVMINLGYYIKSKEILEFQAIIEAELKKMERNNG